MSFGKRCVSLASGLTVDSVQTMPSIGFGTYQAPKGEVGAAVSAALASGYRHIDCAAIYGNEAEVGDALASAMAGGLQRQDLFVTSKLWNSEHAPEHVRPACLQSLADLKLDHLDLYIIHWPQQMEKVEGHSGVLWMPDAMLLPLKPYRLKPYK